MSVGGRASQLRLSQSIASYQSDLGRRQLARRRQVLNTCIVILHANKLYAVYGSTCKVDPYMATCKVCIVSSVYVYTQLRNCVLNLVHSLSPGNLNNYVDLVHTGTKFTYMSGTAVLCLAVPRYLSTRVLQYM